MFLRVARWIPANGILFAALVFAAYLLVGDRPDDGATDAAVGAYYGDDGSRTKELLSLFLVGLAGLCFLSFLGSFRGLLARAEGEPARLTTAATASGATFVALALAAHAVESSPALAVEVFDTVTLDPNTVKVALAAGLGLFLISLFAAASMAAAAGVLALSSGALPRRLGYAAFGAAAAGVAAFFAPVLSLVVLAWIVAVSAWMLAPRRSEVPGSVATTP